MTHKTWFAGFTKIGAVLALLLSPSAFAAGSISAARPGFLKTKPQFQVIAEANAYHPEVTGLVTRFHSGEGGSSLLEGLFCSLDYPDETMSYTSETGESVTVWQSGGTCTIAPENLQAYKKIVISLSAANDFHYLSYCERNQCDFILSDYDPDQEEFEIHVGRF